MGGTRVSVITPVYNAVNYLREGLESVQHQTFGAGNIEHIIVDDGSTDGSGELLDRWAAAHADNTRLLRQPNSGSPGSPRNRGLAEAQGDYVFFLDADDWLGEESIERLVAAAEEHGTDIVMGKIVGTNGRADKKQAFLRHLPRTTVFDSYAFWSVGPWKLFRTGLLRDHGLQFPTEMLFGEDSVFVTRAFLHAEAISILTDYDYMYLRKRDDGGNITALGRRDAAGAAYQWINTVDRTCEAIREFNLGARQEGYLFKRLFHLQCKSAIHHMGKVKDPVRQAELHAQIKEVFDRWATPSTLRELKPAAQVLYAALPTASVEEIVRLKDEYDTMELEGRADGLYAAHPEWTDADFERWAVEVAALYPLRTKITVDDELGGYRHLQGNLTFAHVPKDRISATLRCRLRGGRTELRFPVDLSDAKFSVDVPVNRLAFEKQGLRRRWDLYLEVDYGDYTTRDLLSLDLSSRTRSRLRRLASRWRPI